MVYRIYSEKKTGVSVAAPELMNELREVLGIKKLESLRIINRYDAEGISKEIFEQAKITVFSNPSVDKTFNRLDEIGADEKDVVFAIEFLPGQFNQRAQGAVQCLSALSPESEPVVKTAQIFVLSGDLSGNDVEKIKKYIINPVECREAILGKYASLTEKYPDGEGIETLTGFTGLGSEELSRFAQDNSLAMDKDDIAFCQKYFRDEEGRDPTLTEIKMIDTYWSDHCRHTTFLTEITDAKISAPYLKDAYEKYLDLREDVYAGRIPKPQTLMDIATMAMRKLKKDGLLDALDESDEVNACTVKIKAKIGGEEQDWLLLFKNETHNHPTEIEPFGGAATCLGGGIRDPLSGRAYVYQAMRITGAGDVRAPFDSTLPGKLSQRTITRTAAKGYSNYGNQIGLASGPLTEIYHDGYVAKRMELGALVGAAPADWVVRGEPKPGDVVILLGARTGRDGCGGATSSSKSHNTASGETCAAEVQKGDAVEERKIVRLFRQPEATKLIKRCNDFGAGGVSVAIGELADGLAIDLDKVPLKYAGLSVTETAISESQERMAVVVEAASAEKFISMAEAENLEATVVATVTEEKRLVMFWRGQKAVNLSRSFLGSNGAPKKTQVCAPDRETSNLFDIPLSGESFAGKYLNLASDLNICSQKGIADMFGSTSGSGTVLLPFGGKTGKTPANVMAGLIPAPGAEESGTASVMGFGFDPMLSEKSPFHGAAAAVVHSVAKLTATGCSREKMWLSFQEYFPRPGKDPCRWGLPFEALLGALQAQIGLSLASIGGKDSMSGTFEDIDVPPTLVSFAVSVMDADKVVSGEFQKAGSNLFLLPPALNEDNTFDYEEILRRFDFVLNAMQSGSVLSASAPGAGGVLESVMKSAFGNMIGVSFDKGLDRDLISKKMFGGIILECSGTLPGAEAAGAVLIGRTAEKPVLSGFGEEVSLAELLEAWEKPLSNVFPVDAKAEGNAPDIAFEKRNNASPAVKTAKPRVLIPVFPGTNGEWDCERAFLQAGAEVETFIVRNKKPEMILESISELASAIGRSQILMFPGGSSGGDEPEGGGKLIAAFFKNRQLSEALSQHLEVRGGLILGICNGFQALMRMGLLPFGEIREPSEGGPALCQNLIGRVQSLLCRTRVTSVLSPWFAECSVGDIYTAPVAHGEGRFVASGEMLDELMRNGQIAAQYVDENGRPAMQTPFNPSGSMWAVEALTSPDGRVLGKMSHPERTGKNLYRNVKGNFDSGIFRSGVKYFS